MQNVAITKSADEKDILLREIHHRVKNNLQVISSILGIQSRSVTDVKAKAAIKEGRSRVHSMSLIHQNLYKKDDLTGISIKDYLDKLGHDLLSTYAIEPDKVNIHIEADDMILDVETVVPIGLIVNELISNSLKYAFPDGAKGNIYIKMQQEERHLILSVADDGIGLDPDQLKLKEGTSVLIKIANYKIY